MAKIVEGLDDYNQMEVHVMAVITQKTKLDLLKKVGKNLNTKKVSIPDALVEAINHYISCEK